MMNLISGVHLKPGHPMPCAFPFPRIPATHWLLFCVAIWPAVMPPTASAQLTRLPAPDTTRGTFFGTSTALEGTLAVVGAPGANACGTRSGEVNVFRLAEETMTWTLDATLIPRDCHEEHFFGSHVDVSGGRIAATSNRPFFRESTSNAVYIYEFDSLSGAWSQVQRIEEPKAEGRGEFANAMVLSGDFLAVTTAGDTSGNTYNGVVYVYERQNGRFELTATLESPVSSDEAVFGASVDADGDLLAVGASTWAREEPAIVFTYRREPTGSWVLEETIRGVDSFFVPISLSDGRLAIGESRAQRDESGRVRILERETDGSWELVHTLRPETPYDHGAFGSLVRISGKRLAIVGYDEQLAMDRNIDRIVYVFSLSGGGEWRQTQVVDVGDTAFASSIDIVGQMALIGMAGDRVAGQAFVARLR